MTHAISVFGLGYVGTVTAACLAHRGNTVIGVDLNHTKVDAVNSGKSPIVEPQVKEIIAEAHEAGRLRATRSAEDAILNSEISFLCVGTPSLRNGKLDLGNIEPVCAEIGEILKRKTTFHTVVLRSTVLPGTAETVVVPTLERASGKRHRRGLRCLCESGVHARRHSSCGFYGTCDDGHWCERQSSQCDSP